MSILYSPSSGEDFLLKKTTWIFGLGFMTNIKTEFSSSSHSPHPSLVSFARPTLQTISHPPLQSAAPFSPKANLKEKMLRCRTDHNWRSMRILYSKHKVNQRDPNIPLRYPTTCSFFPFCTSRLINTISHPEPSPCSRSRWDDVHSEKHHQISFLWCQSSRNKLLLERHTF